MSVLSGLRTRVLVGAIAVALTGGFAGVGASAAPIPSTVSSNVLTPAAPIPPAADATLKSLKITSPKKVALKPKFKSKVVKYTAVVPFGTKKVVFKAVPTQAKATVVIKAPKKYKLGNNKVTITVTAINKKAKKVYTVLIKILSKDAALSGLTAATPTAGLVFDQAFDPKVLSYTASAAVGTKSISFNAVPRAKGATVTNDAPAVFPEGATTVKITVTAPDKKTKTVYTVVVNVIPAWTIDPSLASLVVTNPARVSLSPSFTPDTTAYTVRVPVGTKAVSFSSTAAQAAKGATVATVAPPSYSLGNNTVTITVTAPDKKTVRVYTLTVVVPEARNNDPSLSSLGIDSPAGVGLTPAFDPTVLSYTATAPVGTTAVRFVESTTQPTATVKVDEPKTYQPGDNTVTITTTAPDGVTTRTYSITVKVLRAATVVVDANPNDIVGGFTVNVQLKNAALSATATLGNETACATSNPNVTIGAPNLFDVVAVSVTGVFKGCTITLSFDASANPGYAVGPINSITRVSKSDIVVFTPGTSTATADGFIATWTVTNGSIENCALTADRPAGANLDTFDNNGATVSGLLTSMSAAVECTFAADPLMFNIAPQTVSGSSLRPSKMTVGKPASTADGFLFSISATGCVFNKASVTTTSGAVTIANPTKGLYSVTVSGLKPAAKATVTVTCVGAAGFAGLPDAPKTVEGAAATSTQLPVTVVPRIADASDLDPNSPPASEADLPGLTAGVQPQVLYITTPVWDTTAAVSTTYTWQVSNADRDRDGVQCSDPNYGIGTDFGTNLWTDFDDRAKAALDRAVPQLLRVGILVTKRPDYVGKCFRVNVKGTSGARSTTLTTAAVPLSSTEPPAICKTRPGYTGPTGLDLDTGVAFAERGNLVIATDGVCEGSLGLAMSYQWQGTSATDPTNSKAAWVNLNNTTQRLVVTGADLGTAIRVVVRYKADNGTFDIASDPLAVSGSTVVPVSTAAASIKGGGTGAAASRLTLDIGSWDNAGGAKLIVTWEYLSNEAGSDWVAVDDQSSVTARVYSAKTSKPGKYRAKVTFSSYIEGLYDPVTVTTNEVSWSLV